MLELSIGIAVYNEEKNIERALRLILAQDIGSLPIKLREVIVVSDCSTDSSDEIIQKIAREFAVVRLFRMEKRSGKSAVMDRIVHLAGSDIVAAFDADAFPEPDCLKHMLQPLVTRPEVGGTSGRKIPYNRAMMPHAFWEMCHYFNLAAPKMSGSVMAFRNVVKSIPHALAVDDMYIQIELERQSLKVVYVPEVVARTVEPDTLSGYFHQRNRIYRGYLQLLKEEKVRLPSVGIAIPIKALVGAIRAHPNKAFSFMLCSSFEVIIRIWASIGHGLKRPAPYIYKRVRQ